MPPSNNNSITYCVDTSALLDIFHRYPPNVFIKLWEFINRLVVEERFITVLEVKEECEEEFLTQWFSQHPNVIIPSSENIETKLSMIVNDLQSRNYQLFDYNDPTNRGTDALIIALTLSMINLHPDIHYKLLQHEKPNNLQQNSHKVKIPNVCDMYRIEYIDFINLIELENWIFN